MLEGKPLLPILALPVLTHSAKKLHCYQNGKSREGRKECLHSPSLFGARKTPFSEEEKALEGREDPGMRFGRSSFPRLARRRRRRRRLRRRRRQLRYNRKSTEKFPFLPSLSGEGIGSPCPPASLKGPFPSPPAGNRRHNDRPLIPPQFKTIYFLELNYSSKSKAVATDTIP